MLFCFSCAHEGSGNEVNAKQADGDSCALANLQFELAQSLLGGRKLSQAYDDQVAVLQAKLINKRLELQSVFRNLQADEGAILTKAREVFDLENQCQALAIEYQIQIREMLTAEQLRNWCTPNDWCLPHRPGKQR